jgi:thiamine pyrophosphate-dependent acetolactate synthase large subunit-like protein
MKFTTASLLLRYLAAENEYIFGIPDTSLVPLYDATNRQDALNKKVLQ